MSNKSEISDVISKLRVIDKKIKFNNKIFTLKRESVAYIENSFGEFYLYHIKIDDPWKDYFVLVKSERFEDFMPVFRKKEIALRIDSGCMTGEVFGDKTCDCRNELNKSMKLILGLGEGMIINIPSQDGRGFGIDFKADTTVLIHEFGMDTVNAFKVLSGKKSAEKRTYEAIIPLLEFFGIKKDKTIGVITNNPGKLSMLSDAGYKVKRIPLMIKINNPTFRKNIRSKKEELGHMT